MDWAPFRKAVKPYSIGSVINMLRDGAHLGRLNSNDALAAGLEFSRECCFTHTPHSRSEWLSQSQSFPNKEPNSI